MYPSATRSSFSLLLLLIIQTLFQSSSTVLMSSQINQSQLASTKLLDDFERFRKMVEHHLRRRPGPGVVINVIEEWGREFVEYFVSICLCFLFDATLILL